MRRALFGLILAVVCSAYVSLGAQVPVLHPTQLALVSQSYHLWFHPPLHVGSPSNANTSASAEADEQIRGLRLGLASPPAPGSLSIPEDWSCDSIGTGQLSGTPNGGVEGGNSAGPWLGIDGSGVTYYTDDTLYYCSTTLTGDYEIVTEVTVSLTIPSPFANPKAGPMIRQSLAANSPHGWCNSSRPFDNQTQLGQTDFLYRLTSGGDTMSTGLTTGAATVWRRARKIGVTVDCAYSTVGSDGPWVLRGSAQNAGLSGVVRYGLAVSADDLTAMARGVFTTVIIQPSVPDDEEDFGNYRAQFYGFGTNTRGAWGCGSNPTLYRVTSLAGSGANTLRAAMEASGPRVVVLETSGTISLSDDNIDVTSPCLTVAGQTAPSPGITVTDGGIVVYSNNVVLQHLRVRPSDSGAVIPQTAGHDAMLLYDYPPTGTSAYNIVLDHMSLSWSGGKLLNLFTTNGIGNVTVWRSILSEALYRAANIISTQGDGNPYSLATLVAGNVGNQSILQNLYAHNGARHPEIHENARVVFGNNVVYNWGHQGNEPGNYYPWATFFYSPAPGPFLTSLVGNAYISGPGAYPPQGTLYAIGVWTGAAGSQIYKSDNLIDQNEAPVTEYINYMGFDPLVGSSPVSLTGITILPSATLESFLLPKVGARPLDRDSVDTRIIAEVTGRTGMMITSQSEVGGLPSLAVNSNSYSEPASPNAVGSCGASRTNQECHLETLAQALEP